jgi:GxxExxY protein
MTELMVEGRAPFAGDHAELTERVIGIFFRVANELGFGFNEAVYRRAMCVALTRSGLVAEEELAVPVWFWGESVGTFYADIVVAGVLVLELKVSEHVTKANEAQLLHYLRASTMEVGLVMTFGEVPKFRRVVMANSRKRSVVSRKIQVTDADKTDKYG